MTLTYTVATGTSLQGASASATTATGSTGDLIVAFLGVGAGSSAAIIPAAPTGTISSWTAAAAGITAGSATCAIRAFYASAASSAAVTVTMADSSGGTFGWNMLWVFRIPGAAFDVAPAATGNSAGATSFTTAATTGTVGGLALAGFAGYTGAVATTMGVGSGWTSGGALGGTTANYGAGIAETKDVLSTGAVTGAPATSTATLYWTGQIVTVKATSTTLTLTSAGGIASGGAFGAGMVTPDPAALTSAGGLVSGETFGAAVITPAPVTLTGFGIPSGLVFGVGFVDAGLRGTGIVSAEAFGTSSVIPDPVSLIGFGIISGLTFGAGVVTGNILAGAGIVSGETFGSATVTPAPAALNGIGIASAETFGAPVVVLAIVEISAQILIRPAPSVAYDLVCVARVPQPSGPPVLIPIDPIDWTGLSWTDELSKPQQLNAGCPISSLTEPVLQRLRSLHELASELWLYRNGKLVFAGPWLGWQVQGETLTMNAVGLLGYLRLMIVQADRVYSGVDQFAIATGLIDQWQNLPYGNFGIDTTGIAPSGIIRDATYLTKELHIVGQRVAELGLRQNGFDVAVDPLSRKLLLSYPRAGVDRSFGEDAIVFDDRNVTSPNITCSVAPGDVASEGFGVGTGNGAGLFSTRSNLNLRAQYGRSAVTASFNDVSVQATLDAYVQGLVDARAAALLIPGPNVRVTPDSDVGAYDVGDTVSYQLHSQLSVAGAYRLRKRTVTAATGGQETVAAEFV